MFLSDLSGGENNWKEKNLGTALKVSLMSTKSSDAKLPVFVLNSTSLTQIKTFRCASVLIYFKLVRYCTFNYLKYPFFFHVLLK